MIQIVIMRKHLIAFTFLAMILSPSLRAQVLCDLPATCNILKSFKLEQEIQQITLAGSDPHHSKPSIKSLKKYFKADQIVTGPTEITSWSTPIIKRRNNSKDYLIPTPKELGVEMTKSSNAHNLAHFWLYPTYYCKVYQKLRARFNQGKFGCPLNHIQEWFLANQSKLKDFQFVMLHDGLLPFFESQGLRAFALKSSREHDHTTPASLKGLVKLTREHKNIVFILETQVKAPKALNRYSESFKHTIKINTLGEMNKAPGQVLIDLKQKISTIIE